MTSNMPESDSKCHQCNLNNPPGQGEIINFNNLVDFWLSNSWRRLGWKKAFHISASLMYNESDNPEDIERIWKEVTEANTRALDEVINEANNNPKIPQYLNQISREHGFDHIMVSLPFMATSPSEPQDHDFCIWTARKDDIGFYLGIRRFSAERKEDIIVNSAEAAKEVEEYGRFKKYFIRPESTTYLFCMVLRDLGDAEPSLKRILSIYDA